MPKDLIGRWKMFAAGKLVVAYLFPLKIGFLLFAKNPELVFGKRAHQALVVVKRIWCLITFVVL